MTDGSGDGVYDLLRGACVRPRQGDGRHYLLPNRVLPSLREGCCMDLLYPSDMLRVRRVRILLGNANSGVEVVVLSDPRSQSTTSTDFCIEIPGNAKRTATFPPTRLLVPHATVLRATTTRHVLAMYIATKLYDVFFNI